MPGRLKYPAGNYTAVGSVRVEDSVGVRPASFVETGNSLEPFPASAGRRYRVGDVARRRRRGVRRRKYGTRSLLRSRNRTPGGAHRLPYSTPTTPFCALRRPPTIATDCRRLLRHRDDHPTTSRIPSTSLDAKTLAPSSGDFATSCRTQGK